MPPLQPHSGLTLLPGLACDGSLFAAQMPAWGGLAGLGAPQVSDVHTRAATLPAMARLFLAERPGPQVLVGCSMGGMLALEIWRQAPHRVRGMALLGSTARPDTPELIALRSQACERFAQGRVDEVLRANVLFAFHPLSRARPGLVEAYLAMVHRAGAEQLIRQNRAVMARIDSRPDLPRVRCPVLLACGEADRLTPPAHTQEMAAALASGGAPVRMEIVPGAGHLLTLEQPGRVNALLRDWLAALPGAQP